MAAIDVEIKTINRDLASARKYLSELQSELSTPNLNSLERDAIQSSIATIRANVSNLETKLTAAQATAAQPTASSADTTGQAQAARDDGANTSAAPVTQKEVGPDGRVAQKAADAPTNADLPKTTANGNTDTGTNEPVRPIAQTQSLKSPPVAEYDPNIAYRVDVNGVGSRGDDAATTTNPTASRLNVLYAGAQNAIKSQDNILDKFASYTYSLSWYLLDRETSNTLISSDIKNINNYYLLVPSGGAPIQTKTQSDVPVTSTGRSPFFPLDFYLDNFEIESTVSGTPGSRGAAKLSTVSFTVTEPNGISLQQNLIRAVNDLYWNKGYAKKGTPINYNEAHYCMVIRFYGYDEKGDLVVPIDQRVGITDRQAAIEKFVPFVITSIDFKVANKLVEYRINAAPPAQLTAFSTDRGSIPQSFQFQGKTVSDILVGTTQNIPIPNDGWGEG
jgi:hypothetical protein